MNGFDIRLAVYLVDGPTELVQFFCQLSGFIWFFVSLVFVAKNAEGKSSLWVRKLDALASHALAGTELEFIVFDDTYLHDASNESDAPRAVLAGRGVLMTLEGNELRVRAARGVGFQISTTVRDRVLRERTSIILLG